MIETIGQAFLLNFDDSDDTCQVGAAVITTDQMLAVGGLVGYIPGPVGVQLIKLAASADVRVTVLINDPPLRVVALSWGDIDVEKLYNIIARGIAESSMKAVFQALTEVEHELYAGLVSDDDTPHD